MPRSLILNESIRTREVRLIGEDGEQVGVISENEALNRTADADLDLVLVSPSVKPPVARIMDYGKYRFEQQRKPKKSRKEPKTISVKEIRLSPTIEGNDFDTESSHVREFLNKEDAKIRISIHFRGRAITRTELGLKIPEKMADTTKNIVNITAKPKMKGRSMLLMLAPKGKRDRK